MPVPESRRPLVGKIRRRATVPSWLWIPAGAVLFLLGGPLIALLIKAPWRDLPNIFTSSEALTALKLSLITASASTVLCVLLGTPLAVLLAKLSGPVITVIRGLLIVPLVLSPVVSGIALLYFWGRSGVFGAALNMLGMDVGFSPYAVILTQTFVSLPFYVISALTSLLAVDEDVELAAATSGASAQQILRHITMPLALPGLVVGAVLAFARSLGEYGATITFAGSIEGKTQTLPLQISLALNSSAPTTAIGLSLMLIALFLLVMLLSRALGGRVLGQLSPR